MTTCKLWITPTRVVSLAACLIALVGAGSAEAQVQPPSVTLTIAAGDSGTETKTITLPAVPRMADIQIAIDTTGSMGPAITHVQAEATAIVNAVRAVAPDANFSVVQFRDNEDLAEYQVVQGFTNDAGLVQSAINSLSASGGGIDAAEAYNLVFHNSYSFDREPDPGWRTGARKFVVVIGDAEPHGAGSEGFPGCADTSADPLGLSATTELAGMRAAERTLFMVLATTAFKSTTLQCYDSLAAAAFTGSDAVETPGAMPLSDQVVALIKSATATVSDLHLEVASADPPPAAASWISFSPTSVGPVPTPSTHTFMLTTSVPAGTPPGTYTFRIIAVADGAEVGSQQLDIVVPGALECAGEAATIVGTGGPDTIVGTAGRDVIQALDGDDQVSGLGGNDLVCGGEGDDTLQGGSGKDQLYGDDGDDGLLANSGDDQVFGGAGEDELRGGTGNDRLSGDAGDDELRGNDGDDRLSGGRGSDELSGGRGDDQLTGGAGNDELSGDSGDDRLLGGRGNDELSGDSGNDRLDGGLGTNQSNGGAGADDCMNPDPATGAVNCETAVRQAQQA